MCMPYVTKYRKRALVTQISVQSYDRKLVTNRSLVNFLISVLLSFAYLLTQEQCSCMLLLLHMKSLLVTEVWSHDANDAVAMEVA